MCDRALAVLVVLDDLEVVFEDFVFDDLDGLCSKSLIRERWTKDMNMICVSEKLITSSTVLYLYKRLTSIVGLVVGLDLVGLVVGFPVGGGVGSSSQLVSSKDSASRH